MSSAAIAVRHQISPPGVSSDTVAIVPSVTVSNSGALALKMPHSNHPASSTTPASPGDDYGSTDEVKVFKDEGDKEDEQSSGENLLLEEKSSLIDLTESEVSYAEFLSPKRIIKILKIFSFISFCLNIRTNQIKRRDKIIVHYMVKT